MMINNIVAIVGRPNVGKSTLFNRLTQTRDSITHDEPGVTRDRIYGEVNWKNKDFILIDTGGIQLKEHLNFQKEINIQAQFAIDEADIIIFLTSYEDQIVYDDEYVAKLLKKYPNKKVFIVANKFDGNDQNPEQEYLWEKLGFGKPFFVSSSHGINVGDLLNAITSYLEEHEAKPNPTSEFSFCLIGKPNVGKSSIANALVKEQRSIVSEIAGTTRDSVYIDLVYDKKHFTLVDTAGIKRMNRALDSIEEISILKTKLAIERSNFAVFVIDGSQSLSKMDLDIAATLNESEKPFLIIVNKSDMLNEVEIEKIKKELKVKLNYVDWAQVFFTSAINKKNLHKIFEGLYNIKQNLNIPISELELSHLVLNLGFLQAPPKVKGRTVKIHQIKVIKKELMPPIFLLYVNDTTLMPESYERFVLNKIRVGFDIKYIPIYMKLKNYKR